MIYGSWDINCNRQNFFVILGHFLIFYHPNSPKNEEKKTPGDIIFQKCTKTHDHMLYCSWDMVREGCNYFSFFALSPTFDLPLPPLVAQKMKISTKWKEPMEISSFYTSVSKTMIICYTVPEIWCMTDVIVIFDFGLGNFLPFYPHNSPKNQNFKKMKKRLDVWSFYTCVQKIMIRWCTVPKIWCDRGGCPPKNKTKEKYQKDKSMQSWSEKRIQDNKNHEEKTDTEV